MRRSTRRSIAAPPPPLEDEVRSSVGSFSTKFSLPTFVKRVEKLTDEQRNAIKRTGFGNLLLFPSHMLSKNLLSELMDKWDYDKLGFEIGSRIVPITLMDVALILGLPVVGEPVILKEDEEFTDLEVEFGAAVSKRQIGISSIKKRLDSLGETCNDDFVRTFLLFTMGTLLFPNSSDKVDSRYLSLLRNVDDVSHFAWGVAVLDEILTWLKKRKESSIQYIGGCLIFLQIWSYEHIIDIGRPNLSDSDLTFPRVCRWGNSRSNRQQWFVEKFRELEDHQVICELEPTPEEEGLSIVRELLRTQTDEDELGPEQQFLVVDDTDDETDLDTVTIEVAATVENSNLEDLQASTSGYELEDHQKFPGRMSTSGEAQVNSPNSNVKVASIEILSDTTVGSSMEELESVDVDTRSDQVSHSAPMEDHNKVAAIEILSDIPTAASSREELESVVVDTRSNQESHSELIKDHNKEEGSRKEKQLLEEIQMLKEQVAVLTDKLETAEMKNEMYRLSFYEYESRMVEISHDKETSNADESREVTLIDT
ncbi:Protein MAIN-LIKE 1 [Linum perenne]